MNAPRATVLDGPDAELRAHLIASQLGGLLQSWDIAEDQDLAAASRDRIVALYGAALQALVDPPSTAAGVRRA